MARRTRAAMIEETRIKLLAAARHAFGTIGYAATSMDELTDQAGLTRGALYHHFGDKKGLLRAVVAEIDAEMDARLLLVSKDTPDVWRGFYSRCRVYLEMALEPEIQRIVFQDARAVFGRTLFAERQQQCIDSLALLLGDMMRQGIVAPADPHALACLINGALVDAAFWIAESGRKEERLPQALGALDLLVRGLRNPSAK